MLVGAARLAPGSFAAGCRRLVGRQADQVQQPLLKRQRAISTSTSCTTNKAATTVDERPGQQMAAGSQREEQLGRGGGGATPKKPKQIVMPTPVPPPIAPSDPSIWHNAVLLVEKPPEWTSFDVCGKLSPVLAALLGKKNREVKVGHAGTLDPMATGLLIVCVGRGTKAVNTFMDMRKEYSGTLRLGEATPSFDADTPVQRRVPWEHITDEDLFRAREGLVGQIQQLPPMYSAIKVGGQRLYEAARKGKEVERQARTVTVERFDLWRDAADAQSVHFRIVCSKGTYIRCLAHDLGATLGSAAHLTALRREAIGEYRVEGAWDVQQLVQQLKEQRQQLKEREQQEQQQPQDAAATAVAADQSSQQQCC